MAIVKKIDSNITGLRIAEETSIGVVSVGAEWIPLEPNSYSDFGGDIKMVARNPINPSRQNKKGVTTDLDANGGLNSDFTQTNLASLLQGFMFADFRRKQEYPVFGGAGVAIAIASGANTYTAASIGTGMFVGDLIFVTGCTNAANNGLKRVTTVAAGVLTVAESLVTETSPTTAKIVKVGFQFTSGDADIDASVAFARLTCTTKDATQFGLIPGEFVFVGGDDPTAVTGNQFATAANNGFKRVKSVAAGSIVFDKSAADMVTEALGDRTIRIFFGRALKNESSSTFIKRRTYQLERTLGAPDDGNPSQIQSEYLTGAVPNDFTLNVPIADKLTADLSFVSINNEQRTGVAGVKSGTRPALSESSAFNTSSDVTRIRLAQTSTADEAPDDLFAFITDLKLMIKNGATPNKAVGTLGAFDITVGNFVVELSIDAYFSDVAAVTAVRNNVDCTVDFQFAKENSGFAVDVPLVSLGDARAKVEQDQPITLPLTVSAATGAKYDANMDHTLFFVFFDYLPTAAQ